MFSEPIIIVVVFVLCRCLGLLEEAPMGQLDQGEAKVVAVV